MQAAPVRRTTYPVWMRVARAVMFLPLPTRNRRAQVVSSVLRWSDVMLSWSALSSVFRLLNVRCLWVVIVFGCYAMWGCNDESIISISAALNTALSFKNTKYLDLDGSFDLERDVVIGGFSLKDGLMKPLDKPGLGVELI